MATKFYTFAGKAMWAKVFNPDSYQGGPQKYKISLVVDDDNYYKFKDSGIRTVPKKDEDDNWVLNFSRAAEPTKINRENGDIVSIGGGQPLVTDYQNMVWGEQGLIGNGSKVEVKVSVYDTKMGKGQRLDVVKVIDHIPYESTSVVYEEPSTQDTTKSEVVDDTKDLNDEIPF